MCLGGLKGLKGAKFSFQDHIDWTIVFKDICVVPLALKAESLILPTEASQPLAVTLTAFGLSLQSGFGLEGWGPQDLIPDPLFCPGWNLIKGSHVPYLTMERAKMG